MLAILGALDQLAPLEHANVTGDAQSGQIGLQHLRADTGVGIGRAAAGARPDRQLEAALAPGFAQQLAGALDVVRPVLQLFVVAPQCRRVGGDGRARIAFAILRANVGGLVERQVQRLAHAHVIQRRVAGVDADIGGEQRVQFQHLQPSIGLERGDVHRTRIQGDLAVAGLEPLLADVGLGGDGQQQAVDGRGTIPVVGVGAKAHLGILGIAFEDERAGADGLAVEALGCMLGEQLVGVLGRIDGGETHGQVGQEWRFRVPEHEAHAIVVELFHTLDQLPQAHGFGVGKAAQRQLVPGVIRVELTLEAPQHIVGVEGASRGERRVAVEFHPLAQVEGVAQTVVADAPALRQRGNDLGAAGSEGHQALEQGLCAGVGGGRRGVLDDIETFRARFGAHHQAVSRLDVCAQQGGQQQAAT